MLTLKAQYFINLGAEFHDLQVLYYAAHAEAKTVSDAQELGSVQAHLERVHNLCFQLKLETSRELIRTRLEYDKLPRTYEAFEILKDAVFADLRDKWFTYIPSDRLQYFSENTVASAEVWNSFPSAYEELHSAGICYALGQATASVFHSMRAVEIGVQAMAKALHVTFTYPNELAEMGKVIGGIEEKINESKIGARTAEKDAALRFYSEAAAQFRHFNNGWRIRVSHARASYEDRQAKDVIDHVRSFLETLAEKLTETPS
jgi:hypothetical protein